MNQTPRSVFSQWVCTGAVVAGISSFASPGAAMPIFRLGYAFTNLDITIGGFNNSGDVVGSMRSTNQAAGTSTSAFLMRNGTVYDLFPTGLTPAATLAYGNAVSQRKPDGSVQAVGMVSQTDSFRRAISWTIAPDGSFTAQALTNLVLGTNTVALGEQGEGEALAVNSTGSIVGDGNSYLAGVGLRWDPPYGLPREYFLSTASSLPAINDQGVVCANEVEFDHGTSNDRFTAAILNPSVVEIPGLTNGPSDEVVVDAMSGDRVVGIARAGDGIRRAFVWTIGAPAVVVLPDPPGLNVTQSEAESVNATGDVVGYVEYLNAPQFGQAGTYLVLWKNLNGVYSPYLLTDLFPLETKQAAYPPRTDGLRVRINDPGLVVMDYLWGFDRQIRVYQPVHDGLIQFSTPGFSAQETDGFINATVTLFRADENTQPVTVQYQTSDGDATAGTNYVAQSGTVTWSPTESGDKTVRVPVLHTPAYEPYQSFNLSLSHPTNASLGNWTNVSLTITDPYEMLQFANLDPMQGGYVVVQGQTSVVLELQRLGGTDGTLVITNLSTQDGTAMAGADYVGLTNVSLTWQPGDAAPKGITVQLLGAAASFSVKSFYLSGNGYLDNTNNPMFASVGVNVVPTNQVPQPSFDASVLSAQKGSLSLRSSLAQGATLVIENSTNLLTWSPAAELPSSNGVVQFLAPFQAGARAQFFRAHVK